MSLSGFKVLTIFVTLSLFFSNKIQAEDLKFSTRPDTTIKYYSDTSVIRFDYKQSALFYEYTLSSIDSIINILKNDKRVTLTIDGYAYKDEGSDEICYWISFNRAAFLQTYILGRGIDSSRIIAVNAFGRKKQFKNIDKNGLTVNCRAEILVNRPLPSEQIVNADRDLDGIIDIEDKCPDVFGHRDRQGCPDTALVIVPFPVQQSVLFFKTYEVLDSVIQVLKANPVYSITIYGHADKHEGIDGICNNLSSERSDIVKRYLESRMISASRIKTIKNFGNSRPLNPGRNPLEISQNSRAEILFNN